MSENVSRPALTLTSENDGQLQVRFISEVSVRPQFCRQRVVDFVVDAAVAVRLTEFREHRATVFGHRVKKAARRGPVNVERGESPTHQITPAQRALRRKLRVDPIYCFMKACMASSKPAVST